MSLSPHEAEALCKRAALGAGLSCAMAEQLATASGWLCARGIDACNPAIALLFRHDEEGQAQAGPQALRSPWEGAEGWLCPVAAGVVLADLRPGALTAPLLLRRLALPVMLLPFAAALSRQAGHAVTLKWTGGQATTDGDGFTLSPPPPMADVSLTFDDSPASLPQRHRYITPAPDPMILVSLNIYATRAQVRAPDQGDQTDTDTNQERTP